MPWRIRRRKDQYCVEKVGGGIVPGGCHDTREAAIEHQRALYAGKEASVNAAAFADQPDFSDGAMVALYPRPEEAAALISSDGHGVDDLHLTLVFLGDAVDVPAEEAHAAVERASRSIGPLSGTIGGVGMFQAGEDGVPMLLLPDVKGLTRLREGVVDELESIGISSPSEHGFLPHMTVGYRESVDGFEGDDRIGHEIHFDALSLVLGIERTDHPLEEASVSD